MAVSALGVDGSAVITTRPAIAPFAGFQYRTTVETEPAHPQDEGTQSGQRHVGAREGTDFTVGAVFAFTRAKQQYASQGRSGTCHVYDAGAGEVTEAKITEVVHTEHIGATPGPRAFQRVDKASHEDREYQERPQLHALGNRAGHDGHGGGHEHDLEEEVRGR